MAHPQGIASLVPATVARGELSRPVGQEAIQIAMQKGNINIGARQSTEVLELSESSLQAQEQHAETLRRFEAQRRSRSVVVPTAPEDVKLQLRELGHPITLFGENHADRRIRLQEVIAEMELDTDDAGKLQSIMNKSQAAKEAAAAPLERLKETVYTEASSDLVSARTFMAQYSFTRAHERILRTKRTRESDELSRQEDEHAARLYVHSKEVGLNSTQFGDERPMTSIRFSPDATRLATGSLTALVRLFDTTTLECTGTLRGHQERVTKLCWHPEATATSMMPLLVTASADSRALLWNTNDGTIRQTYAGHQGILSGVDIHPSGRLLGTASHDHTWRLWDLETGTELLLQDGHSKECSSIAFQPDGALVLTGDYAGTIHIWDLRSGQSVCALQGHVKKVLNAHFSSNGWQVATGSDDHMVRIWDLRKKKTGYVLPAHSNVISDVRYSSSGELLLTSSFDGTLKVWTTRDYTLLKTLSGHTGKVMSCDISVDEKRIASAGFDRTIKLWAHKDEF